MLCSSAAHQLHPPHTVPHVQYCCTPTVPATYCAACAVCCTPTALTAPAFPKPLIKQEQNAALPFSI